MDPLETDSTEPSERASAPDVDPRIGKLVDHRYRILESMAAGSMGAVYKAERVPVGKLVALKFLHASFARDSEFQLRFERETRVMSKLAHPNCVSVVDFGVWDGAPYLAMEYVAGTTLRAMLDKGPLPIGRALVLARQIAAGLAHAHSQGVVHRDVKPANIMISDEVGTGDHVRILDFGLARLRSGGGRDATQTNVVVGTPNYMAPEQTIGGGNIDARTDIYAVGVVMFEMIAGQRPFAASDTMALLGMHRAAPTPKLVDRMSPLAKDAAIHERVQELIEKAMAKSPDDRFQSAVELADAIVSVAEATRAASTQAMRRSNEELVGPRSSSEHQVPSVVPTRARTEPPIAIDVKKEATAPVRPSMPEVRGGSSKRWVLALFCLAAAALVVWFMVLRRGGEAEPDRPELAATVPPLVPDANTLVPDAAQAVVVDAGAAVVVANTLVPDAAEAVVADAGAAVVVANTLVPDAAEAVSVDAEAPPPPDAADEIEMDPLTADNPDPEADKNVAEDEAPDAPDTVDEEKQPPPPTRATTTKDAIAMIKEGKRELAIASLLGLKKQQPSNANIPFLLGNLYFDKRWWSVAIDQYAQAIKKASAYKRNAVLNRNMIKMLASPRTVRKAQNFIRGTIGKPAKPYLASAAKNDRNANVRKYSAALSKQIR